MLDLICDERLQVLDDLIENTSYCKKNPPLFLSKYSKSIAFATPDDIRKFLVAKDSKGKIKIHDIICPNLGNVGIFDCHCPLRRASSTVQTTLGQLKRILKVMGKEVDGMEIQAWKSCR